MVYDNELTDAFFNCLAHVCCSLAKLPPTIIISLEKRCRYIPGFLSIILLIKHNCRLNFSLDKLTVASPYYEHFMRCLEHSYSTPKGELKFQARQIPTDFPQYSLYDRVKEMVSLNYSYSYLHTNFSIYTIHTFTRNCGS